MSPDEIIATWEQPMSDVGKTLFEMRRCLVQEAKLCGYAEVQNLPLTDLFLLYVQYQRETR